MVLQVMYSDFLTLVHSGNVHTAGIDDATDKIYFSLKGHSSHQATEVVPVAAAAPAAPVHANSGEDSPLPCPCPRPLSVLHILQIS